MSQSFSFSFHLKLTFVLCKIEFRFSVSFGTMEVAITFFCWWLPLPHLVVLVVDLASFGGVVDAPASCRGGGGPLPPSRGSVG